MRIPENIKILPPWHIVSAEDSKRLHAELQRELPPEHPLTDLDAIAVARRYDQNDVLFQISDSEMFLAQVHLTWQEENNPTWPRTKFFGSWQQWIEETTLHDYRERISSDDPKTDS